MEITEVFHPKTRAAWRRWLARHHSSGKTEIWLRRYKKATGKPAISYDDMVEESLCFGWIDGITKKYCDESSVQRITPRRKKSFLSELNRQRIWKLQKLGLMTEAGITPIADQIGSPDDPFEIPDWLESELRADPKVWKTFTAFPHFYKRLRVGWLAACRDGNRDDVFQTRVAHLIKMTARGKHYGTEPLADLDFSSISN